MQYVVRSPENLVEKIDEFVDGRRFKSRNQLINIVLADWLATQIHPVDPFATTYGKPPGYDELLKEERTHSKRALLADEWDKYRAQRADLLDGEYEERLRWEEMERLTRQQELLNDVKGEIEKRLLPQLREEIKEQIKAAMEPQDEPPKPKRKAKRKATKPKTSR